jgi:hypothetical protein
MERRKKIYLDIASLQAEQFMLVQNLGSLCL